jgi:spore coat protein CotH
MTLSRRRTATVTATMALLLSACGQTSDDLRARTDSETSADEVRTTAAVYDASVVHSVSVEFDPDDFDAMVETFDDTGDKEWIPATVTIDGETFEDAGLRLKGNSSLREVDVDTDPAEIPWLIKLDEFVEGQELDGYTQFVVRSSGTETALNEAVALDLLEEAGLVSEHAVATRFSVNGGEARLRLVVQNLDGTWDDENFDSDGILYKAEAGGDYSYRGEDPDAYTNVFDQETATDDERLEPLIDLLEFINNSDDETFAAELGEHLDLQAFATYLAFEDLIANGDDIDGPGNNSYLRYDETTGAFTVVAWDHNGAFGGFGRPGGMGDRPDGAPRGVGPAGGAPGAGGPAGAGGPGGGANVLVERFTADPAFNALYEQAAADLRASLYESGDAQAVLDAWVDVLTEQAADLVDESTVDSEADAIGAYFDDGT